MFWLVATAYIWLAIASTLIASRRVREPVDEGAAKAATGQRKDNWLACIVIWLVLLNESASARDALLLLGGIVLVWLVGRTARRVRLLRGPTRG